MPSFQTDPLLAGANVVVLMLAAILFDALLGEWPWIARWLPTPRRLADGLVTLIAPRLDRRHRAPTVRMMRGALLVLVVVVLAGGAGWAIQTVARAHPLGWLVEFLILLSIISQRGPIDALIRTWRSLDRQTLEEARTTLRDITGRPADHLDNHGVVRRTVEFAGRAFCGRVVAPLFWYALAGLPGLLIQTAVDITDIRIGSRTEHGTRFGLTAARLNDVLTMIPARLAGLMVALAAPFVPTARPGGALAALTREPGKSPSAAAGWPQAALAGALDLSLGGPDRIAGELVKLPWIGNGRARATTRDMRRAAWMLGVACVLNAILVAGLVLLRL